MPVPGERVGRGQQGGSSNDRRFPQGHSGATRGIDSRGGVEGGGREASQTPSLR